MNRILLVSLLFLVACMNRDAKVKRVTDIGTAIMNADTSGMIRPDIPDLLYLDDKFIKDIPILRRAGKNYKLITQTSDIDGGSLGKAEYSLRILTDAYGVAIRLRYNASQNKFEILSWRKL